VAFLKYAYAQTVEPAISGRGWSKIRTASGGSDANLVEKASEILGENFDPHRYLLTHATIVASVDVEEVPNVKLGSVLDPNTGRRINRKWTDYRVIPECDKFINNNCFIPGTLITMADGTVKAIEDICEGDEVLTHLGRPKRVTATMRRDVVEELREIKPLGTTERLYVTAEHPFYVFRENACVNCGSPARQHVSWNARCISHLIGKFYCSSECYYAKRVPKRELLEEKRGEFVEAKDLTDRDFTASPVLRGAKDVGLTLGQARLIGLFLAEGYYEQDSRNDNERVGAIWAFHKDEAPTLARLVRDLMKREFGVECVIRPHKNDNGIHVTTRTHRDAAAFFTKWVRGSGSKTKTLHPDLLFASADIQMEIARGWLEGDGCFQDTRTEKKPGDIRLTGDTSNRSLASQMQIILQRLGISSHLTRIESPGRKRLIVDGEIKIVNDPEKPRNVSWALACGGAWVEDLVQDTVYEEPYLAAVEERGGLQAAPKLRFLNGYHLQIIENLDTIAYAGPVYNFDVEDDHSYVANGVAVHNCDAWARPVLMKSYRTFIGAQNFCEHLQKEEESKGRIIDAVARDIGPSVYIDILLATDRRHTGLVRDIESGKMSTLSMGCFLAGTQVSLQDGQRVAIEEVVPGDMVLTHKGRFREVLNTQIRTYRGELRRIKAVGVSSTIQATANHGFEILRAPKTCACGCGEPLGETSSITRRTTRRFKRGHDKRIYNPNNTYSLAEARRRKQQITDLKALRFEKVRADELEVGDFLCFPKVLFHLQTKGWTVGKARLAGYFLAEGSYLKHKGEHVEVQFNFSMEEKDTYVREVVELLKEEFPEANEPWVQDRPSRNTCVVHMTGRDAVAWFYKHCGEYSHGKRVSFEAMHVPAELHRHLVGAWINGDGTLGKDNKTLSGTTTSYALACQLHLLLTRCGVFVRMECAQNGRAIELAEAVGAGWMPDPETGKRPAITLAVGLSSAQQLRGYSDKVGRPSEAQQQLRVLDDHVVFPVNSVESGWYEGPVYNMEVEEDHTYVVEGVAVHNCSVTETICTKCGNVGADETELCNHVRFEKGNYFYDDKGNKHRVAELCGHPTLANGGVNFIEASWVATPAFGGAVARNILTPTGMSPEMLRQAQRVLSEPPPQWLDRLAKAASKEPPSDFSEAIQVSQAESPAKSRTRVSDYYAPDGPGAIIGEPGSAPEEILGFDFGDDEGGGEEEKKPEEKPEAGPLDQLTDAVYQQVLDRVTQKVQDELAGRGEQPSVQEPANSTGEDIIKQAAHKRAYRLGIEAIVKSASGDAHLIDAVARFNSRMGVKVPRALYMAALSLGPLSKHGSIEEWAVNAHSALNRTPSLGETKTLLRLGKLLDQMAAFTNHNHKVEESRNG